MNAPVKVPPETEQVGNDTTLPDIEQTVSLGEKPKPETSTTEPAELDDALREIEGPLNVVVVA